MNRFIKIFSLTAFIAVASVATAQESTNVRAEKKDKATEITDQIDRKVTLTTEQRAKVLEFASEYSTQIAEIKKDKEHFADLKKELDGKYIVKVKSILTSEQKTKFDAFVNEQKANKK